jgi:hypothetical protein
MRQWLNINGGAKEEGGQTMSTDDEVLIASKQFYAKLNRMANLRRHIHTVSECQDLEDCP